MAACEGMIRFRSIAEITAVITRPKGRIDSDGSVKCHYERSHALSAYQRDRAPFGRVMYSEQRSVLGLLFSGVAPHIDRRCRCPETGHFLTFAHDARRRALFDRTVVVCDRKQTRHRRALPGTSLG
jgi:hypothetical protein